MKWSSWVKSGGWAGCCVTVVGTMESISTWRPIQWDRCFSDFLEKRPWVVLLTSKHFSNLFGRPPPESGTCPYCKRKRKLFVKLKNFVETWIFCLCVISRLWLQPERVWRTRVLLVQEGFNRERNFTLYRAVVNVSTSPAMWRNLAICWTVDTQVNTCHVPTVSRDSWLRLRSFAKTSLPKQRPKSSKGSRWGTTTKPWYWWWGVRFKGSWRLWTSEGSSPCAMSVTKSSLWVWLFGYPWRQRTTANWKMSRHVCPWGSYSKTWRKCVGRFEMRLKYGPHKERDLFHHFLAELLEMNCKNEDVQNWTHVVKSCHDTSCKHCVAFVNIFSPQSRPSGYIAIANQENFYSWVKLELYKVFCSLLKNM